MNFTPGLNYKGPGAYQANSIFDFQKQRNVKSKNDSNNSKQLIKSINVQSKIIDKIAFKTCSSRFSGNANITNFPGENKKGQGITIAS